MSPEMAIAVAALVSACGIGLGSLYFGVRHGNATLQQAATQGQNTEQALAQMLRAIQDVDANIDALRRELYGQYESVRSLVSNEANAIRTHSTQGHLDTRAVIRDQLGHR